MKTFKQFLLEKEYSDDNSFIDPDFIKKQSEKINRGTEKKRIANNKEKLEKKNTEGYVKRFIEMGKNSLNRIGISNANSIENKKLYKIGRSMGGGDNNEPFDNSNSDVAIDVANHCIKHHSKEVPSPERVQLAADKINTPSENFRSKTFLDKKDGGENFFIEPPNGSFKLKNCNGLNGLDGLARVNNKYYAIEFKNNNKKNERYGEVFINTIKNSKLDITPIYVFGANEDNIDKVRKLQEKYKGNIFTGGQFTEWKIKNNCLHINIKTTDNKKDWVQKAIKKYGLQKFLNLESKLLESECFNY